MFTIPEWLVLRVGRLELENEALRRQVAELQAQLAAAPAPTQTTAEPESRS